VTTPTELEQFTNKNVQNVSCGKYHTLFLVDGNVWATGGNKDGQIGNGSTQSVYKPIKLKKMSHIKVISAWHSSAALTKQGEVFIWGTPNCHTPSKIQN
jgi:alpha-tubulin suppressor-like RCC1 family protein